MKGWRSEKYAGLKMAAGKKGKVSGGKTGVRIGGREGG